MSILNKNIKQILSEKDLNNKFLSSKHNNLDFKCNFLQNNFYLDSNNYFPITKEKYSFPDLFMWGDSNKYNKIYSNNFLKEFEKNINNFKSFDNVFVLGSCSFDNYYRNIITFLPRIFFIKEKKLQLAIHRNSSNKLRNFLKMFFDKIGIEFNFIFLDDGFFYFTNSKIPQFISTGQSIEILNQLKLKPNSKKEKIYITRQNSFFRTLVNEDDIIIKLKKQGFEVIDLNYLDIFDQIKLFSESKIIVSATGSGLANMVFCNEGTKIIEISPQYKFDYENSLKFRYSYIAENLNLKYLRIEADPINSDNSNYKYKNAINKKVFHESNYYKNLVLKIDKLKDIINFSK